MRCQCNDPGCAGTTDHPFGPGVQCHNEADVLVEVHRTRGGSGDPEVDEEAEVALCVACYSYREGRRDLLELPANVILLEKGKADGHR